MPLDPKKIIEDARKAGLLGSPPDSWPGTPETPAVKLPVEVGLGRIVPQKIVKQPRPLVRERGAKFAQQKKRWVITEKQLAEKLGAKGVIYP